MNKKAFCNTGFFSRYNFINQYRPGCKNGKTDVLSRITTDSSIHSNVSANLFTKIKEAFDGNPVLKNPLENMHWSFS